MLAGFTVGAAAPTLVDADGDAGPDCDPQAVSSAATARQITRRRTRS